MYGAGAGSRSARLAAAWVVVPLLLLVLAGCGGGEDGSAPRLEGLTREQPLQVGSVAMPKVAPGAPDVEVELRAAEGELLFVYFGFTTCPDICPTTLSDLRYALGLLEPIEAARVDVAFITVDPERDAPEILVPYLEHFFERASALRTEDFDQLRRVEQAFGASSTITPDDRGGYDVSHTAISYIVDSSGSVRVEWPFGFPPDSMAHDLRILLDQTGTD